MKTETYPCQGCATSVTRPVSRGQRPKWCVECRRTRTSKIHAIECAQCGAHAMTWAQGRYCSRDCGNAAREKPKAPPRQPTDLRSELRRGYEDNDSQLFFAALVAKADTSGECWVWPRLKDGYPAQRLGKSYIPLHRAVLEMKHGAPLGSQAAHHVCANSACVNPDHLQPVTHRENTAEMLARHSYLRRIDELETALALLDPGNPLLGVIRVA